MPSDDNDDEDRAEAEDRPAGPDSIWFSEEVAERIADHLRFDDETLSAMWERIGMPSRSAAAEALSGWRPSRVAAITVPVDALLPSGEVWGKVFEAYGLGQDTRATWARMFEAADLGGLSVRMNEQLIDMFRGTPSDGEHDGRAPSGDTEAPPAGGGRPARRDDALAAFVILLWTLLTVLSYTTTGEDREQALQARAERIANRRSRPGPS